MGDHSVSYMPYATLPNGPSSSWRDYPLLAGLVEQDAFTNIEAMISGMQDAIEACDLKRLQHEIEMLATNFSSGASQKTGVLAEVHDALPTLLSTLKFLRSQPGTQNDVHDTVIPTLFLALASLEPDEGHKLPLATFCDVAQSVAGVFKSKHYPQALGVLRHANGDDTHCVNLIQS
ncbi:hypothetical protein EYR40_006061 [Pleurotus pulmonarius]|nr:hypothetical protein EYR36_005559 [Pleurotus pulmonarius]KAF4602843.1 hypothetical protein EYR40_006061 [Pleurotus pulmonarius]